MTEKKHEPNNMHDLHKLDHSLVTNNQFAIAVTIQGRLETEGWGRGGFEVRGTTFTGEIRKVEGSDGSQVVPARPSCEGRPVTSDEGSVTGDGLLGVQWYLG